MKYEMRFIKSFGVNEAGLADLPKKISGTTISRVLDDYGSWAFPRSSKRIYYKTRHRSWKKKPEN